MFTNFKITLRSMVRERFYVGINVLGLAVAFVCSFLIGLHVHSELTSDQHVPQHEKVYRATIDLINSDGSTSFALMSQFMAPTLALQNPAIEDFVRFRTQPTESLVRIKGESYYWDSIYQADENVFEIFGHDAIFGDSVTALQDPGAIAISNSFNQIYFNGANSIGEIITVNDQDYRVTLVFEDPPENTHLKYDALLSINGLVYPDSDALPMSLFTVNTYTYLIMPEHYDTARFSEFFDEFWQRVNGEIMQGSGISIAMHITPIADVHYGGQVEYDQPTGNIFVVYAYAIVGFLILFVACVNYVNLATARSSRRLREVGVRKILGVGRRSLISQFLMESVGITLAAVIMALAIVEILVRLEISGLVASGLSAGLYRDPALLALMLGAGVAVGLLAGAYPAFWISSQFVLSSISNRSANRSDSVLRKVLVIFQFAVTVSVLACSFLVVGQIRFIENAPLGFQTENRLVLLVKGNEAIVRTPVLATRLEELAQVDSTSFTILDPGVGYSSGNWLLENNSGAMESRFLSFQNVDMNYLDVMEMELVAGRFFRETGGVKQVVVNQTLVERMGWENPLGKRSGLPGDAEGSEIVVGVVKDFHFSGMQSEIGPLILRPSFPERFGSANPQARYDQTARITIALANNPDTLILRQIENVWHDTMPELPFDYKYLSDLIGEQYVAETRIMNVVGYFAAICVFVSCLGLLGLSAYSTERRTREIGVRKVLGASIGQIMGMLFRDIFMLVFIGSVIASFISYFSINAWLENFAYRDEISFIVFPVSAAMAVLAAFVTMALQAWSTVSRNPVYALRYE